MSHSLGRCDPRRARSRCTRALVFGAAFLGSASAPAQVPERSATYVPFDVSLVAPLNLFHPDRKIIAGLSLNVLHGVTDAMYGIEVGGAYNRTRERAYGLQISGGVNDVGGDQAGIQVAGGVNIVNGSCGLLQLSGLWNRCRAGGVAIQVAAIGNDAALGGSAGGLAFHGMQLSGAVNHVHRGGALLQVSSINSANAGGGVQLGAIGNVSSRDWRGISVGGLVNHVMGDFGGIQVSGFANWNHSNLETLAFFMAAMGRSPGRTRFELEHNNDGRASGLAIAGVVNLAAHFDGAQLSGVTNIARQGLRGLQITGLLNVAEDVSGGQIGAINVARDVRGFQVGVINVARRLQGVQIGVANIAYGNGLPFMVLVNAGFADFERDTSSARGVDRQGVDLIIRRR